MFFRCGANQKTMDNDNKGIDSKQTRKQKNTEKNLNKEKAEGQSVIQMLKKPTELHPATIRKRENKG